MHNAVGAGHFYAQDAAHPSQYYLPRFAVTSISSNGCHPPVLKERRRINGSLPLTKAVIFIPEIHVRGVVHDV